MIFGISNKTYEAINSVFKNYPNIIAVKVFGSRATDNYSEGSDIDLCVFSKHTIEFNTFLSIRKDIDNLNIPYKVDLCRYDKINNNKLIEHINQVGIIFYQKQSTT